MLAVLVEQLVLLIPSAQVCEPGSVCSLLSILSARIVAVEGLLSGCAKAPVYFAFSLLEFLQCFCDSSGYILKLAFQPGGEWKVQSVTSPGPLTRSSLVERSEVCLSGPEDAKDRGLSQLRH